MNKQESDIMKILLQTPFINQRMLAEASGHSLGVVNRSVKELVAQGYLDEQLWPTSRAKKEFQERSPKRAIILAAGFGMRMVPIYTEVPKGLLEVNKEPLIERQIRQLHEVGIREIYVVVGFMKERYEYLIDEFGVELVVNPDYMTKNNLHSVRLVRRHLENAYIIPCDIWCDRNPFDRYESYSWYMVSDLVENESSVRVNRKMELVTVPEGNGGNAMIGICYLTGEEAGIVAENIEKLSRDLRYDGVFWEEALYRKDKMIVAARVVHGSDVVEINTYEQLRELDSHSGQLKTDAIQVICQALGVKQDEITDITVLKKGMTNRSFLFTTKGKKYIMRIPGEGTEQLIDRREEAAVYQTIDGKKICDDIAYINPENGYKITEFLEGARVCDPDCPGDVEKCMKRLRRFHEIRLIDWEYAGMQDPHVDMAMFAVYAMYDREQVDALIDAYFPEGCKNEIRIKIYCYIAACGLLWSNWCEYKKSLGVEFGEYSLRQYRYAKEYYRIVKEELSQIKGEKNHE